MRLPDEFVTSAQSFYACLPPPWQAPAQALFYRLADTLDGGVDFFQRETLQVLSRVTRFTPQQPNLNRIWSSSDLRLKTVLSRDPVLISDPSAMALFEILTDKTPANAAGFPQMTREHFDHFIFDVPHLFQKGLRLWQWTDRLERITESSDFPSERREAVLRVASAIWTRVKNASLTAPSDLWLLRQILSTHKKLGTLDDLNQGQTIFVEPYARRKNLDPVQLSRDLQLLSVRGYVVPTQGGFRKTMTQAGRVLNVVFPLDGEFQRDMSQELCDWFDGKTDSTREDLLKRWLCFDSKPSTKRSWVGDMQEIEIGYRLLPLILSLKASGLLGTSGLALNRLLPEMTKVLELAGLLFQGKTTPLGVHVFEKGPGIFGITGAYHSYLNALEDLLLSRDKKPWVARGKNIAASRDANRGAIRTAVDSIISYSKQNQTNFSVMIEHAMGYGVGIRTLHRHFGDVPHYYGADFEQTAIEVALQEQREGRLPALMRMVQADIGQPNTLIDFVRYHEDDLSQAVMIVGNGFHEIRRMGDTKLIEVLRDYCKAGITVVFIEESRLTDDQIFHSAWETYNAGFRWYHDTSGQVLRSPSTWKQLFEQAGYRVLPEFSHGTRSIFPCPMDTEENPPISGTFFCVPRS